MIRTTRIPLYGGLLVVCVSADPARELERAGHPTGIEGEDPAEWAVCRGWCAERPFDPDEIEPGESMGRWVVVLKPDVGVEIITHEALHLVNYGTKWYGVPNVEGNDEAAAYLMGWVASTLIGYVDAARK